LAPKDGQELGSVTRNFTPFTPFTPPIRAGMTQKTGKAQETTSYACTFVIGLLGFEPGTS
jgi:hypothetical protein